MKAMKKKMRVFKMKNRKGFAAICASHLTEGRTRIQAIDRMEKALKRKKKRGQDFEIIVYKDFGLVFCFYSNHDAFVRRLWVHHNKGNAFTGNMLFIYIILPSSNLYLDVYF